MNALKIQKYTKVPKIKVSVSVSFWKKWYRCFPTIHHLKKARKVEFTAYLFTHNWISINRVHAHSGPWRTVDPWDGVEGLADVDVEVRRLLSVSVYIFINSFVVTSEMDQRTQVNLVGSVPN